MVVLATEARKVSVEDAISLDRAAWRSIECRRCEEKMKRAVGVSREKLDTSVSDG